MVKHPRQAATAHCGHVSAGSEMSAQCLSLLQRLCVKPCASRRKSGQLRVSGSIGQAGKVGPAAGPSAGFRAVCSVKRCFTPAEAV